jgi:hypothetical protein
MDDLKTVFNKEINMNTEIELKGFLKSLRISILENKAKITKKTIFKYLEYDNKLESIIHSKTIKSEINRDLLAVSFFVFIIGVFCNFLGGDIIFVLSFGISFVFLIAGLFTKKRTITIETHTGTPIILNFKSSNEKTVRDFADLLIEKSKDFIIKKYSRVDKDLPIENQLENIDFLRSNDLITDSRFEELKNIILNKKGSDKLIGFE